MASRKSIRALKFPSEVVNTSGGDFEVRALVPDAVTLLADKYYDVFQAIMVRFADAADRGEDVSLDIPTLVKKAAEVGPKIFAEIIALAAREYDDETVDFIRQEMPFGDQFNAVQKIFYLTFREDTAVGKMVETAVQAGEAAKKELERRMSTPASHSPNGSATSGTV